MQFEDHQVMPFKPMITMMRCKQYFAHCITELVACRAKTDIPLTQAATQTLMDVSVTSAEAQRQLCRAKLKGQVPSHIAALHTHCFQATCDEMAAYSCCSTSNNKDAQTRGSMWLRHQWHLAVHPSPWRCRGRNKQPFHLS